MQTLRVAMPSGVEQPYQYEAEAEAGISLTSGERWFGSRIRFRVGTSGRWHHVIAVNVHPMDGAAVEATLRAHLESNTGGVVARQQS